MSTATAPAELLSGDAIITPEEKPIVVIFRRFRRHRLAMVSSAVIHHYLPGLFSGAVYRSFRPG